MIAFNKVHTFPSCPFHLYDTAHLPRLIEKQATFCNKLNCASCEQFCKQRVINHHMLRCHARTSCLALNAFSQCNAIACYMLLKTVSVEPTFQCDDVANCRLPENCLSKIPPRSMLQRTKFSWKNKDGFQRNLYFAMLLTMSIKLGEPSRAYIFEFTARSVSALREIQPPGKLENKRKT